MQDISTPPWFIAIGASGSDGLRDLTELLGELPAPLPAVVLVVLHRPWDLPSHLRDVLARATKLPVVVASEGEAFQCGHVYVGEPGDHLTLVEKSLGSLVTDPGMEYRNRTVDLLFRSVARHAGRRMIGVVLSGALDDGSRGLAAIHEAGGTTMVLTPGRQAFGGMPENAISFDGPIDLIGSPSLIAAEICRITAEDREQADA